VFSQGLIDHFSGLVIEGEEISLSSHETEEVIEEVFNTLTLLNCCHKQSIELTFLSHF
jgi:hypothetical protein